MFAHFKHAGMLLIILFARKLTIAHGTMKLLDRVVIFQMQGQVASVTKDFRALRALDGLFLVRALVQLEAPFTGSHDFSANVTFLPESVKMNGGLMRSEARGNGKAFRANLAIHPAPVTTLMGQHHPQQILGLRLSRHTLRLAQTALKGFENRRELFG